MRGIIDKIFGQLIFVYLSNKQTWESEDVVKLHSTLSYLEKPEETILNDLRNKLSNMKMLDIGVGAGRTTRYFAHLTKDYVGIDYSQNMIKVCREKFRKYPKKISFEVSDARALQFFEDSYFDFVLFSHNGLDYMNHEDRSRALLEISRVTKNGGYFCFSTHNLNSAPELFLLRSSSNPIKLLYERHRLFLMRLHNKNSWKDLRNKQHTILNDGTYGFRLRTYFIRPKEEIKQLTELEFTNIKIYSSLDGREITNPLKIENAIDPWLYYLCNVG